MEIRQVQIEDSQSLLNLMLRLDNETKFMLFESGERETTLEQQINIIQSFLANDNKAMFVLVDSDSVHGFIVGVGNSAKRNKHSLSCVMGIEQFVTGLGYGKQLLDTLESWSVMNKFTRIELTVMCHNERAHRLYLSNGFEVEGVKRNSLIIDGQYVDEYYMSKLLLAHKGSLSSI